MGYSVKERLAMLRQSDPARYNALMSRTSDDQKRAILTEWRYTARPDQLPDPSWWDPAGEAFEWWIITGRGWGKV